MIDPISAFILSKITDAFFQAVADKVVDKTFEKLKEDVAKGAFEAALEAAISAYAKSGHRLDLARPLVGVKTRDSILTIPEVANELACLLQFNRKPNTQLIGKIWRDSLDTPPAWINFTTEAATFISCLENELRDTEVFRPVFDSKNLGAIASGVDLSAESLAQVNTSLKELLDLMNSRLGELVGYTSGASEDIQREIIDSSNYIAERTGNFVGRGFIFNEILEFATKNPQGYFILTGDPGIGKTAVLAQFIKAHGCVHHFNIRSGGINTRERFLRNVCAQLIVKYQLNYSYLEPTVDKDNNFLCKLLDEVSSKIGSYDKCFIVVDALDETMEPKPYSNVLVLPEILPTGIIIILSARRRSDFNLKAPSCVIRERFIQQDESANESDIRQYLTLRITAQGIQTYIAKQVLSEVQFVEYMTKEKAQGNFIYLKLVLDDMEKGKYRNLAIRDLPAGLMNYYEDHWRLMRKVGDDIWFTYKLPVVMALTMVEEPVSVDLIADFSQIHQLPRIREVLQEWSQFIYETFVNYKGTLQKRYRIYHASFHDFITAKEEVADERVSRVTTKKQMVAVMRSVREEIKTGKWKKS